MIEDDSLATVQITTTPAKKILLIVKMTNKYKNAFITMENKSTGKTDLVMSLAGLFPIVL
jgi:hypothetical protein